MQAIPRPIEITQIIILTPKKSITLPIYGRIYDDVNVATRYSVVIVVRLISNSFAIWSTTTNPIQEDYPGVENIFPIVAAIKIIYP